MKYQATNIRKITRDLEAVARAIETHECDSGRQMLIHLFKRDQHNIRLSPFFFAHEFASKDGAVTIIIHKDMLDKLNTLRQALNKPVVITSGYRTPEHNARIPGAATESMHLEGKAADITVAGMTPAQVAEAAEKVGFNGIGVYSTFTHVDVRDTKTRWNG